MNAGCNCFVKDGDAIGCDEKDALEKLKLAQEDCESNVSKVQSSFLKGLGRLIETMC